MQEAGCHLHDDCEELKSTGVKQTTDKLLWLASVPCAAENSARKMTRMSLCVATLSSLTFSFDDIVCTNRASQRP